MVAVIRESNGKLAAGDKYGEEYGEYESQLQDRCIQYCDREQYLSLVLNAIASLPELRSTDVDVLSILYADPKFAVSAAQRAHQSRICVCGDRPNQFSHARVRTQCDWCCDS
jgi:hypothetical protein